MYQGKIGRNLSFPFEMAGRYWLPWEVGVEGRPERERGWGNERNVAKIARAFLSQTHTHTQTVTRSHSSGGWALLEGQIFGGAFFPLFSLIHKKVLLRCGDWQPVFSRASRQSVSCDLYIFWTDLMPSDDGCLIARDEERCDELVLLGVLKNLATSFTRIYTIARSQIDITTPLK